VGFSNRVVETSQTRREEQQRPLSVSEIERDTVSAVTHPFRKAVEARDEAAIEASLADDVVFTWQYASDPSTAAVTLGNYTRIRSVEKTGDLEVRVNFKEPTLDWSSP